MKERVAQILESLRSILAKLFCLVRGRGCCISGLAVLAALAAALVLLVFNPLDAVLERGRHLSSYRAEVLKGLVAPKEIPKECLRVSEHEITQPEGCTDYIAQFNFLAHVASSLDGQLHAQLYTEAKHDWFVCVLVNRINFSLSAFATSATHPVYDPLRLLTYTVLLLSLAGLVLAVMSRFGLKALDPCDVFKGLVPYDSSGGAGQGGEGGGQHGAGGMDGGKGRGSVTALLALKAAIAVLLAVPVLIPTVNVSLKSYEDARTAANSLSPNAQSLEKSIRELGGRIEKSGDALTTAGTVVSALSQKISEFPAKPVPVTLQGEIGKPLIEFKPVIEVKPPPSTPVDLNVVTSHLDGIKKSIEDRGSTLNEINTSTKLLDQKFGKFGDSLLAGNAILGASMLNLQGLQSLAVRSGESNLSQVQQMCLLCSQYQLYQGAHETSQWPPDKNYPGAMQTLATILADECSNKSIVELCAPPDKTRSGPK